ncbi:B12-binding domain-containing radical SAM protein [Bacteroidota bacterium]
MVTEASRGCPHACTYCQLNIKPVPYRTRPVKDVVDDLKNSRSLPWFKRKMAMILDNHLGGDLENAKEIIKAIAKLKFWAVGVQFSVECLRDNEFIDLLSKANCRMAFIGMESLNEKSLKAVNKKQNKVKEYKDFFEQLTKKGVLSFVGLMFALDEDTMNYYEELPKMLDDIGVSVILPSIAIPIYGTPLYRQMESEKRIIDYDISHYEGDHVVFRHKYLTEDEIYESYRRINRIFYSPFKILKRWIKIITKQSIQESIPQFVLKILVITFVYFKLSIFQRHHAQKRVFKKLNQKKNILDFSLREGNETAA